MGRGEMLRNKEILGDVNVSNAYGMRNKYKKILRLFGSCQKENEKNFTCGSPPEKKSKKDKPKAGNFNGIRDRKELFTRNMQESWLELPDTLKRKRERICEEILSEYHSGDESCNEQEETIEGASGINREKNLSKLGFSNFRSYMLKHYSYGTEDDCEHFRKRFDECETPVVADKKQSNSAPCKETDNYKIGCELLKFSKLTDGHDVTGKKEGKYNAGKQSGKDYREGEKSSEAKKAKSSRESSNVVDDRNSEQETNRTKLQQVHVSSEKSDSGKSLMDENHTGDSGLESNNNSEAETVYAILNKRFKAEARGLKKNHWSRMAKTHFRKSDDHPKLDGESKQSESPSTEEAAVPGKSAKVPNEPRAVVIDVEKNLPQLSAGDLPNNLGLFVNEDFKSYTRVGCPLSIEVKNDIVNESVVKDETSDRMPNPQLICNATESDYPNETGGEEKILNFKHYTEEEKAKKKSAEAIAKELSTQIFGRRHEGNGGRDEERKEQREPDAEGSKEEPTSKERVVNKAPVSDRQKERLESQDGSEMLYSTVADCVRALERGAPREAEPPGTKTSAEKPGSDLSGKLTIREILHRFEELGSRREKIFTSEEERTATLKQIQQNLKCLEEKVKSFESRNEKKYQQSPENVRIVDKTSGSWTGKGPVNRIIQSNGRTGENDEESAPAAVHDGKHSLLQFAIHHFRQSPEKFEMLKTSDGSISGSLKVIEKSKKSKEKGKVQAKDPSEWTWKEQVDLVKFTAKPIEQSLLRLDTTELNDLAVECFVCLMRYMGDLPMPTDVSEVKCVYTILMHCHRFEQLRDEVYCQLMKQTTNNKSVQQESCQRGWRLFSIVAAYFLCSDTLKPFLFKYLETAAYDKRRAYHGTATVCLQNLRKTFKYGGRKNVPSVEEITAISAGRNSKRQIYRLPGGTEKVVNTKSTTVVQDVIEELCIMINVTNPQEMEEFSVYCIVEGDTFTMPLAREEYILDVTTELQKNHQIFCLIFCRSVWSYPLRLDSQLYVEVVFNQIAPDYLEGLLLVMPGESLEQEFIYDIAKIAALLHRAADMTHVPTMKETKFLLPKPALSIRDVKPSQWVNMVQSNWQECEGITTIQAKAQFLDVLSKWPLFGSSFFAIKKASEPKERTDQILALNRNGVHFIDLATHETLLQYPFSEVISTRKVKSEDGTLFLDMKCGNLMQQRITRLQTDQAHEISRLIRQYITIQQITNVSHMQ